MSNSTTYGLTFLQRIMRSKSSLSVIFFVYCVSILSQLIIVLSDTSSYAVSAKPLTRLIAVLVDDSIYQGYQQQIDRYASQYLQTQYSNSKALIIPIKAANFQAQDIHKILQNLYFGGQKDTPSQLIGITLIGDIPLPVVDDNGFQYPTIYPYIDFLTPQFVYSEQAKTFIHNPQGTSQDPELRHNLIRFDTLGEYNKFFKKLVAYAGWPEVWVDKKIWIDDLIGEQTSYDQGSVLNYANQFVFAEDIGRQRYTNLLLDLTNAQEGSKVYDIFSNAAQSNPSSPAIVNSYNDLPYDLAKQQEDTAENIAGYFKRIATLAKILTKPKAPQPNTFDSDKVSGLSSSQGVPTLFQQQIMDGYFKDYFQLYSEDYHTSLNNLVEPSGRYINSGDKIEINSHIWKTYQHDELTKAIIINLNDQLEGSIDNFIEDEKLYMTVPVPTKKLQYRPPTLKNRSVTRNLILDEVFDVSYFGSDPGTSKNIQDMMIFRGTYNNLTGVGQLSGYNYVMRSPLLGGDGSNKSSASIGSTYGFQSREVEANRGYNVMLVQQDMDLFEGNGKNLKVGWFKQVFGGGQCPNKNINDIDVYKDRYRGGYTPLNIDPTNIVDQGKLQLNIKRLDHLQIRSPSYAVNGAVFGGTVYDVAGSRLVGPQRILNVTEGTEEVTTVYKTNPDWVAPSECDDMMEGQGESVSNYAAAKENYETSCLGQNPEEPDERVCESERQIVESLLNDITSFNQDSDVQNLIDICIESPQAYTVLNPSISKRPILLAGLSDNYLSYTTFAAVQRTTDRRDYSTEQRYYSSNVVNNIHKYLGQDGLNYAIAEAVNKKSVRPILFCARDRKKDNYVFDTVNFFTNVNRDPFIGEKIRIMVSPVGGSSIKPLTDLEIQIAKNCEPVFEKIEKLEEEKAERQKKWYKAILPVVAIFRAFTSKKEQIKETEASNSSCFNNSEDIYQYIKTDPNSKRDRHEIMHDYFYETMSSLYVHKSPTIDELYGKELTTLRGVQFKYAYPNPLEEVGGNSRRRYSLDGYQFDGIKVEVDSTSFILIPGKDFSDNGINSKIYFLEAASLPLYGKNISLKNMMGVLNNGVYNLTGSDEPLSRGEIEGGGRSPFFYPRYGGMNMGTSDRPIDSVRYSSFQGVGGDLVKLVYPNLYNIPVFTTTANGSNKLKSEIQIQKAIKEYLIGQAKLYRKTLEEQYEKRNLFYIGNKIGFDILAKADRYASPIGRPAYDLSKLTDDYFIRNLAMNVGGKILSSDDVIVVLARNLYYQNLIVEEYSPSPVLDTQLSNLYTSIGINNLNLKRKFVFDTYLKNDSDKLPLTTIPRLKDRKSLSGTMIPAYDINGYEIVSINSNGSDYHIDPNYNPIKKFQITSDITNAQPRNELFKETLAPLVCDNKTFDRGGVPILQYPKAFSCWLEDVKSSSITITANGDLIDIIKNFKEGGWKAAATGYFADQIGYLDAWNTTLDQTAQLGPQVKSLINSAVNVATLGAKPNALGTDYQKRRGNVGAISGGLLRNDVYDPTAMTEDARAMTQVLRNLSIKTSSYQMRLASTGTLALASINTNDAYSISIAGTGSACMLLNGINTCTQPILLDNRGTTTGQRADYQLSVAPGSKLGDAGLILTICLKSSGTCIPYPLVYTIVPGTISTIKGIDILNGGYLARGSKMPLVIQGYDAEKNLLRTAVDPYRIISDQGTIDYMGRTSTGLDINTWNNLTLIYDSSVISKGVSQDRITVSPLEYDELLPIFTYTVALADPVLQISDRAGPLSLSKGFTIQLPSKPGILTSSIGSGVTSLVKDSIPKIRLSLQQFGGKDVLGEAIITSQNGLVTVGAIGSKQISGTNNTTTTQQVWSDQNSFVLTGGGQDVYLYPSYRAGQDLIQVRIGTRTRSIPLSVEAGDAAGAVINAPESMKVGITGDVDFAVTDYRGNTILGDTWLDIRSYGWMFGFGKSANETRKIDGGLSIKAKNGVARIGVVAQVIIGKGYITAQIPQLALDQQRSTYAGVLIQGVLRPTEQINGLIMELNGTDRGSLRSNVLPTRALSVLSKSDKLLSVVTKLSDVSKLRQSQLILNPHGAVGGSQAAGSILTLRQGSWNIVRNDDMVLSLDISAPYLLSQVDETILSTSPNAKERGVYYIPISDSTITENRVNLNSIVVNNTILLDTRLGTMHPEVILRYEDATNYDAGVYSVEYRGKQVGKLVMYRPDSMVTIDPALFQYQVSDLYKVIVGYAHGSTNSDAALHIVTRDSSYVSKTIDRSPGDSLIVQFGQGLSVGDATKNNDQFSINYGDAALSRTTINTPAYALVEALGKPVSQDMPYDTGIGQMIYHDPEKSIERVKSIDINNDELKDLMIIYGDGSIRVLKNYGGKQPRRDLGHLMIIADGIKDVIVGDVDKNGYQDIVVHTQQGKLRVYYNDKGRFDVDGYPVCLNIPNGPDDLSKLYYWTMRDMDLDKGIDIVTYDYNGDIKIFYGGRGGDDEGSSYVSKDHDLCDTGWKSRQRSTLVQSFGMNLLSTPIKDESLIHWANAVTVNNPYDAEITVDTSNPGQYQNYDDLNALESANTPTITNDTVIKSMGILETDFSDVANSLDTTSPTFGADLAKDVINSVDSTAMINSAYIDATRYTVVPDTLRPKHKTTGPALYFVSSKLTPFEAFSTSKIFKDLNGGVLLDRDLVEITVTISGPAGVPFAYLDKLTGPWVVPLSTQGKLEGMSQAFEDYSPYVSFNNNGYIFAINGATMNANGSIKLSYIVQYRSEQLVDISVYDTPTYPAIKASSIDGCQKVQRDMTCQGSSSPRNYSLYVSDFKKSIIDGNTASYQQYDANAQKQLGQIAQSITNDNGVFDYIKERWNSDNVFKRILGFADGTYLQSIPTQLRIGLQSGAKEQEISRTITDFTTKLCNGFKPGASSCAGTTPPSGIPFNMAFPPLTPGIVHAMGYKVATDKGLPLLAFPTNITPATPVPIWPPNPLGVGGWLNKGTPSSQFRFYFTPTLTASLGFAFCFGPYPVGKRIPAPFKNVLGNCVVLATKPLLKGQKQCAVSSNPNYTPPPELDLPTCFGDLRANAGSSSPTQMIIIDNQAQARLEKQRLTSPSDLYYNNTYYGGDAWETYANSHPGVKKAIELSNSIISLNKPARVMSTEQIFCLGNCEGTSLDQRIDSKISQRTDKNSPDKAPVERKNGKGVMKGIGACIMQIADSQVRYIKNNLLTSSLTVVLPDLTSLGATSSQRNTLKDNSQGVFSGIKQGGVKTIGVATGVGNSVTDIKLKNMINNNSNLSPNSKIISELGKANINPFYPIQQLFSDIELINIEQKDILVKVPFIRTTDLNLYKAQYAGWVQRNTDIIAQWKDYMDGLTDECFNLSDPAEKQKCNALLKQVVYINTQFGQTKRSIKSNELAFNQYAHFQQIELPNRKEQQVVYLTEMVTVINSTMSQLAGWSTQNAARFGAWTSAVRSMITAVKTRQILIDFAKNRKEKCGTCKVDNYDFAACTLNGLCPSFPLFAWPNFRTPDITIDLSNIDAGIDLVVPNFILQPVDVPLYRIAQLDDLPLPPQLGSPIYAQLNIILPTLPVIPSPPTLPSLPSLSINVDMDLPLLPPAPKIPVLPETLSAMVEVADFIGKILCIVKGDIGLVGESFVKQKIEQITARTREVSPFDTIMPVISQPRPQGYNARLDAYVNLRFYFDGLYNVFDEIVDTQWNQGIQSLTQSFAEVAGSKFETVNGEVNKIISPISTMTDDSILPTPLRYDATIKPLSASDFDARIVGVLGQFADRVEDVKLADRSRALIGWTRTPLQSQVNIAGIEKVRTSAQTLVGDELTQAQKEYQDIKYNYDQWLDTLVSDQYVSDSSQNTSLSSSLYTINPEIAMQIESTDIRGDYLKGSQQLLGSYKDALDRGPEALGMDAQVYQESREYVDHMASLTDMALDNHVLLAQNDEESGPNLNDEDQAPDPLGDGEGGGNSRSDTSSTSRGGSIPTKGITPVGFDNSNRRDGYLVFTLVDTPVGDKPAMVDVIKPEGLGTQYRESSFQEDLNNNPLQGKDIVVWDSHSVYIKYGGQATAHGSNIILSTVYRLPTLNSVVELEKMTNTSDGYLTFDPGILSRSQGYKVWSESYVVTNFKLQGQSYNTALFEWINPDVLGQAKEESYLIRFTDLVDRHPDGAGPDSATSYVLVTPAGTQVDSDTMYISVPGHLTKRNVASLLKNNILHDIVSFDPSDERIVGVMRNLPRVWNYAQVARVQIRDNEYIPTSPWSNQDVGGQQIASDTTAPVAEVKLIRVSGKQDVGGGTSMQGYINTNYELVVTRKDNISLARTSVAGVTQSTARQAVITKIYEQQPTTLNYSFSAQDSSNNVTTINVSIAIQNPQLETTRADNTEGAWGTVTATLTPDLDDGVIKFQQKDSSTWKDLIGSPGGIGGYSVQPFKTIYTGGLYQFANSWGLKNADGTDVGSINEGQISSEDLSLLVKFPQGYPVVSMVNISGIVQYELTYAPQALVGSEPVIIKTPSLYRLLSLENFNASIAGVFAQGSCIAPQVGECEVYVSKKGDIWVDPAVRGNYYGTYVWRDGHSVYQIMRDKTFVAEVNLFTKAIN